MTGITPHPSHDMGSWADIPLGCKKCGKCTCHAPEAIMLMTECQGDAVTHTDNDNLTQPIIMKTYNEGESYLGTAKHLVRSYAEGHFDKSDPEIPYFEVYVVWFCKTLQHWKALVSTTLPDLKYYEVTFNGDTGETYLDVYLKVENKAIPAL